MAVFGWMPGVSSAFSRKFFNVSPTKSSGFLHHIKRGGNYWTQGCPSCFKNFCSLPQPSSNTGQLFSRANRLLRNGSTSYAKPVKNGRLLLVLRTQNFKTSALLKNKMSTNNLTLPKTEVVRKAGAKEMSRLLGLAKGEKWTLTGSSVCFARIIKICRNRKS